MNDSANDNQPCRVLVVEDSRINRLVILQMLKQAALPAGPNAPAAAGTIAGAILGQEATSARQAIEMLQAESYDLVLMDIQMPEMDGLEATRAIRAGAAGDRNLDIPIVAMTAYATPEDEEACYEAGTTGYLSKPISLRQFTAAVVSALEN